MMTAFELVEHIPMPVYALRIAEGEFLLEGLSAVARERSPMLAGLLGRPVTALYRDQPVVIEDALACAAQQRTVTRELPVQTHDHTDATQDLRLTFIPVSSDQLLLCTEDVANSDTRQTALQEAESRYQSLIASLPDGVLLRAADGRILFYNDVAAEIFGAPDRVSLLGGLEVWGDDLQLQTEDGANLGASAEPSRRVLGTGEPERGQVLALAGRGTRRWIRVAAQPIRSPRGDIRGSVTIYTDVTERVSAQAAQRESAARLDLALAAAKMGVWEFAPNSDTGWWSPNLDELFALGGKTRGLSGFVAHIHAEDRPRFSAEAKRLEQSGRDGDSFEHEYRIVGDDQVTRWARIRGSVKDAPGERLLRGTIVDVTEQRQLEEELRRANRLESIGRLAGGVAHDFNNLLAAMLGSVELLEGQCSESAKQDLDLIRHGALRARELTRQLLAFARKQPVEWKDMDLTRLVRNVEVLLRRLVGPGIEIVVVESGPVIVRADPSLLEQVLVNLVVNAREAMPGGGRIAIRVGVLEHNRAEATEGNHVALLEVADSGPGMDDDTRKRAFEPFFTTKVQGTGLGLASCYGIVKQHQGEIEIDSRPGEGTRLRVLLPALPAHRSLTPAPIRVAQTQRTSGRLLVVDDEATVRSTSVRMARSIGYDAVGEADGDAAVRYVDAHPGTVEMLLCDIAMPREDGPSVAARLRARIPQLKVVFMSGFLSAASGTHLEQALYLQKPFTRAELAKKLEELCCAEQSRESAGGH